MRFKRVTVQNFRNLSLAKLSLDASRVFFVGLNGQGKTNMLEAIGYASALRSFRAGENQALIRKGSASAELAYAIDDADGNEASLRVSIKKTGKQATLDGEPVRKASQLVGQFPSITLSSNDMQLIRGSPANRRRFLDTYLCGIDNAYFRSLQDYQKLIHERNALLKRGADKAVMKAFEDQLSQPASLIVRRRAEAIARLEQAAQAKHAAFASGGEKISVSYQPNVAEQDADNFLAILEDNRKRDEVLQHTSRGPHRDDIDFSLNGAAASTFASEGQQRSMALALILATIASWQDMLGQEPVLLVDDALAELDAQRSECFWNCISETTQLIGAGTTLPNNKDSDWLIYRVEAGEFGLAD